MLAHTDTINVHLKLTFEFIYLGIKFFIVDCLKKVENKNSFSSKKSRSAILNFVFIFVFWVNRT